MVERLTFWVRAEGAESAEAAEVFILPGTGRGAE
jgi:hypothetical protein